VPRALTLVATLASLLVAADGRADAPTTTAPAKGAGAERAPTATPPEPPTQAAPTQGAPSKPAAKKTPPRSPLWEQSTLPGEAPARRIVVDRIVAVVGRRVVTLTELRLRSAQPKRPYASLPLADRLAAEQKVERQMLEKMVDEILEEDVCEKRSIVIKPSEVETAFVEVEKNNGLDHPAMLKALKDAGYTEDDYRMELVRQIRHYKVLQTIITPRTATKAGITPDEWMKRLEAEFAVWSAEQRLHAFVETRL
jgi:hypothetical protein